MKIAPRLMLLVAVACCVGWSAASAADLELKPAKPPHPIAKPPAAISTPANDDNIFVAPNATCVSWTDGCRTCTRDQTRGAVNCSNIGVACQPQAISCERQ